MLQLVADPELKEARTVCNADMYVQKKDERRVLKECPFWSHCVISGAFVGHAGTFSWVKINVVLRLPDLIPK